MTDIKPFGSYLSMPHMSTLVDLLRERTQQKPHFSSFTFLVNGESEEATLTNEQLDSLARTIAARLQSSASCGERALLLYPPSLDYIAAFFGCLYADVIAVPAYPPNPAALQRTLPRLQAIIRDAEASVVLTTEPILAMASFLFAQAPELQSLQWIATDSLDGTLADQWRVPNVNQETTAFLQYTSGSTGNPKGVILSHGNLLDNSAHIYRCFGHHSESQGVIWLPPYHDMGLIGGILQPLYGDFPVTLLSPLDFLKRPLRWLEAISKYRATTSGGPNFAYDLCVRKVTSEQIETLDLSSWDLAFNGAEPIRPNSLRQFAETFKPCGFRYEAFYPCYGLAEATLIASGGEKTEAPIERPFPTTPSTQTAEPAQALISCGRTLPEQSIIIANPQTKQQCASGDIGEIWVSGAGIAQGYWGKEEETAVTFAAHLAENNAGPFLRTGDLGFMQDGELFVTGRLKDLIIIRGRNHYPQDIEMTTEQAHAALRPGCSAAFAVTAANAEQLVVVAEIDQRLPDLDTEAIVQTIRERIAGAHDIQPHAVVLIKARSIPKTSSGKIQRYACRRQYLDDELKVVEASVVEMVGVETAVSEPSFLLKSLQTIADTTARHTLLTLHLQQQIAQALHVPTAQISPDRPLTSYGLDSLQSIEVAAEIEQQLEITVPMALLLQEASLSDLCTKLLMQLDEAPESPAPIKPASDTGTFPLSEGQKALWYLYQLAPGSTAYNLPRAVRIHSDLDIEAMRRALSQLITRHSALRTTFTVEDGSPMQTAHPFLAPDLEVVPAGAWSDDALMAALNAESERPFNLEIGPLMRVRIYERGDETAVLLLVLHHIITDFWSLVILVDELSRLYIAERDQKPIQLPEQPVQYTDFVQWQQQMRQTPISRQNRSYWQQQLAGTLPTLNLPLDRPRPPVQTYRGAHRYFRLDKSLSQQLLTFARQAGVTPYMLMLAAYKVLLARYSGQSEIIVGTPTTGRDVTTWLRSFGYFVNPVAIRSHIQPEIPFADFLQTIRQTVLGAFAHQQYPFPLLVDDLDLPRNPSHSPIFQTMFAWQKAQQAGRSSPDNLTGFALGMPDVSFQVNNLWLSSLELMQQASQFDITLMMGDVESQLVGVFEYNTDLFEPATIDRMIGHWQMLLAKLVEGPQTAVSRIPLLTTAETETLLHTWNNTAIDYGEDVCLHELFEQQVARTPNAPALTYDNQTLTYSELNARANQLAHHLQSLGVQPETLVGVCIDRSLEMVIALYAILKAGGAYVPIDPQLPQERIAFMLADTNTPVLLTQNTLKEDGTLTAVPPQTHILCLDTEWEQVAGHSVEGVETHALSRVVGAVTPPNLAYTIYTSGSTGRPKGAMNTHQGIVNRLRWMQAAYQLDASDRVLQKTPFSFDVSVWEFFWPLLTGAQLIIAKPGGHLDSTYLRDTINTYNITTIHFVPSMLQIFLGEPGVDGCTSLRRVICSGEALPTDLQDRFFAKLPQVELHNLYGPTEAAIDVSYWQCQPEQPVPIGRPIDNIQLYILDAKYQPVPIGVAGELHIGGVGVARAYLNRPALTAEKFVPNPFSQLPGDRLYKTGDLVRYRSDGNIEFLGRIDFQVKVRGFRVELGEIETRLTDHPDIKEAIVTIHNADAIGQRLVAYVIPLSTDSELTTASLRTYLQDKLPDYMIPSVVIVLEMMPLTPNGKVNRRALPAPQISRADLHTTYAAPRSIIEQQIAEIWQTHLQVEKVGLYDNFFDLGGHSLLLVQVHRQLQETLAQEIPLVKLLEHPTVQGIAQYLNQGQATETQALQQSAERAQKQRGARRRNRGGRG